MILRAPPVESPSSRAAIAAVKVGCAVARSTMAWALSDRMVLGPDGVLQLGLDGAEAQHLPVGRDRRLIQAL